MNWSERLRADLCSRAAVYTAETNIATYCSRGGTVLFEPSHDGSKHGSFADGSYTAIVANPAWNARAGKVHTQRHVLPESRRERAMELDSCNSSDALLMNLFCFPGFSGTSTVANLMGYEAGEAAPEFGWKGRVPLADGSPDATEIDMKIGRVIVESKLTEADFTSRPQNVVTRYRDFDSVFDLPMLPQTETDYRGYQLVRNILCATAHGYVFTLLCDARRPDLIRDWWSVGRAVRDAALRARLRLVLWQELAAEAPEPLGNFLNSKYGL